MNFTYILFRPSTWKDVYHFRATVNAITSQIPEADVTASVQAITTGSTAATVTVQSVSEVSTAATPSGSTLRLDAGGLIITPRACARGNVIGFVYRLSIVCLSSVVCR